MTFTYDVDDLGTDDVTNVRLEIGDTVDSGHLFEDEEIQFKLDSAGGVLPAAYELCEVLSMRFARQADFSIDNQKVNLSQKSKAYRAMADRIKSRMATSSIESTAIIKVDGYTADTTPTVDWEST